MKKSKESKGSLYTSTSNRASEVNANALNHVAAVQATTMQKGAKQRPRKPRKGRKVKGGAVKALTRAAPQLRNLVPAGYAHAQRWARLLENPFCGENGIKCPFNFNPAPSLMSVNVTTVNYDAGITVAASQTRQATVWPGHYPMANIPSVVGTTGTDYAAQMDAVAYHQGLVSVAGVAAYNVGPCSSTTGTGSTVVSSAMLLSANLAHNANGAVATTTAGHSNYPWDNPYPIMAQIGITGHQRWKMIAMGIRIRNTTPAATRGGNVVTVQPTFQVNAVDYANQSKYSQHPSFRNWGDGTEEIVITWIPRPMDLSYWHLDNVLAATGVDYLETALYGAGIMIWFNAPAQEQTYELTQIAHWEIAGSGSQIFSSKTVASGVTDQQAKLALADHSTVGPTAAGFTKSLDSIVKTGESVTESVGKVFATGARVLSRAL
jgi:hypothetical protein